MNSIKVTPALSVTLNPSNLEPGTIIASRYRVVQRLGSGGVGFVYQVTDENLQGQVVALKLLHPALASDNLIFQRFQNEVLLARKLVHPAIVRVFDFGCLPEGIPFLTMEFVEGGTLKEKLLAHPTGLPFEEVVSILQNLLEVVVYAHSMGIIHRDLKPANILLSHSGELRLVDFGTARTLEGSLQLTQTGQILGTPVYMSPEQIRGESLDVRSDIYSLGIIAFELATGQKPFKAENVMSAMFQHLNEPMPSFAGQKTGSPTWFENIVFRATEKDRATRFQTATEFLSALRAEGEKRAMGDLQGAAQKNARRGSLLFLLGIFFVLLLLVCYRASRPSVFAKQHVSSKDEKSLSLPSAEKNRPVAEKVSTIDVENSLENRIASDIGKTTEFSTEKLITPTPKLPPTEDTSSELTKGVHIELFFRNTAHLEPATQFGLTEIDQIRWIGEVKGLKPLEVESEQIALNFRVIARSLSDGQIVGEFRAKLLSITTDGSESLRIGGSLSSWPSEERKSGTYRLELHHKDSELGFQDISLLSVEKASDL